MNIYLENGCLNIGAILDKGLPWNFVIGGRGIGKTYGALKYVIENKIKFALIRRTQAQADIIGNVALSPIMPVARDMGMEYDVRSIVKACKGIYFDGAETPAGYILALSTISNMRGFDASDVKVLIYDEFIPERHERIFHGELPALLNAYETINRNRELKGEQPLQVLALANSNRLDNPIFTGLDLVKRVSAISAKNRECYVDQARGIAVYDIRRSPISDAKKNTALYKLGDESYNQMALANDYDFDDGNIRVCPLAEYRPMSSIDGITTYKHKSRSEYYVAGKSAGAPAVYGKSDAERLRWRRNFNWMWLEHIYGRVYFDSPTTKIKFVGLFC